VITPESIDRVREAADILEIVGEHVKLKRSGSDWRGPCPFHGGKGPNFSVSPKRNAYHCFVCGVSGDAIGFVREHLGMDFVEAVRYVAARAGVDVQETRAARGPEEVDPREVMWEAMNAAAELFREALWDDAEAAPAREYLASRELTRETAERFGLGWAPREPRWVERLRALGHDDARLLDVGLLVLREGEETPRARFRSRLMFPIHDASNRVVGFGGRVIGAGEPKYLNSPQGTLFDKGRQLYGLSWAKHPIRKQERALVVEGYFDAIRLAAAGLEEVVAPLGTALTESQAALLVKLTKNVFLLYDSDDAGLKATFRAGLELLRLGVSARVVTLPNGEDPDTFVRAHGPERLEHALSQSVDILDRQIQLLERRGWFAELHRKRRAIDKLLPTLRAASDPLTRELYVSRVAEVAGVDRDAILREVEQEERRPGARVSEPEPRPDGDARPPAAGATSHPRRPCGPPTRTTGSCSWSRRGRTTTASAAAGRATAAARGGAARRTGRAPSRCRACRRAPPWRTPRCCSRGPCCSSATWSRSSPRSGPGELHAHRPAPAVRALVAQPDVPLDVLTNAMPESLVRDVDAALEMPDPDPEGTVAGTLGTLQSLALDEERDRLFEMLRDTTDEAEKDRLLLRIAALRQERVALKPVMRRVGPRLRP
jgi:DNA primase